jgi:UDP-glucose 4-epimerase/GDP-4-dehydro-6-deoxy-D-mannose reductase
MTSLKNRLHLFALRWLLVDKPMMKRKRPVKRIYATGMSGTIGRHLPGYILPFDLDLAEPIDRNMIPPDLSTLIHLAGIVGEMNVVKDIGYARRVNVLGTLELAQSLDLETLDRFLYVSTSHVYTPSERDISEDANVGPVAEYPKQKLEAELLLKEYFSTAPEKLLIIRVFSVLGFDAQDFTLGGLASRIANGSSELVINSDDIRDFMTPRQVALGIQKLAETPKISGTFNLCLGEPQSVSNALRKHFNQMGVPAEYYESRFRRGNSTNPRIVGNNSKLIQEVPEITETLRS